MFQFTGYVFLSDDGTSLPPGCPIRTSVSLGLLAARHGFSQLIASFFDSKRQGIRHMPLLA